MSLSLFSLSLSNSPGLLTTPLHSSRKPERDLKEHLSTLENVPLFMKDLPLGDSEDTTAIDALQSLTFDGTPDGEQEK